MERERLGSRLGFILLSAGCAIGCGNVWKFPWMCGQYGGGGFVLIYILCLLLLGLPVMTMEFAVGRAAQASPIHMYQKLERKGQKWHLHGYVAFFGNIALMAFYTVVTGWIIYYFVRFLTGRTEDLGFVTMITNPGVNGTYLAVTVIVAFGILCFNLQGGLERITKYMMTLLMVLMVVLAVHSATLSGAAEGLKFYLVPDFSKITGTVIVGAMNQAFFTLSVGMGSMAIFGSYIGKEQSLLGESANVIVLDTFVAIVAGLIMFPACYTYGLEVNAGPSLLFVTLPTILQDIPLGRLFAIILYVAMIFAGVSSLQNMFEAVAESLMHKFPRLSRTAVLVILCVVCLGFGIGMETIDKWGPWMDLVSIYIIPIGATLGAISWFYVMKKDELLDAVNTGSGKLRGNLWYSVGRYVYVPLAVILCCVALFMHVAF